MKLRESKKKNLVREMGRRIYRLILFVFLLLGGSLTILASVELLIGTIGYIRTRRVYDDANNRFVSVHVKKKEPVSTVSAPEAVSENITVSEDEAEEETDPLQDIDVDLKALREINDEVVGWLYFEDGLISYPILFSGDNAKYLKRNYKEEYMASGSIFLEGQSARDFTDHYTLLYGHNMRDLTMFGKLRYYRSDKNYYKDHEYFRIITEDHVYRYRVFSFKQISSDSDVFSVIDKDSDGLKAFADKYLLTNNNVASEADIKDEDHVLALSTCVNDYAYRFIVCGVRVETTDTKNSGNDGSEKTNVSKNQAAAEKTNVSKNGAAAEKTNVSKNQAASEKTNVSKNKAAAEKTSTQDQAGSGNKGTSPKAVSANGSRTEEKKKTPEQNVSKNSAAIVDVDF